MHRRSLPAWILQENHHRNEEDEKTPNETRRKYPRNSGTNQEETIRSSHKLKNNTPYSFEIPASAGKLRLFDQSQKEVFLNFSRRHQLLVFLAKHGRGTRTHSVSSFPLPIVCSYLSTGSGIVKPTSFQNFAAPGCTGPTLPASGVSRFKLCPLNAMVTLLMHPSEYARRVNS